MGTAARLSHSAERDCVGYTCGQFGERSDRDRRSREKNDLGFAAGERHARPSFISLVRAMVQAPKLNFRRAERPRHRSSQRLPLVQQRDESLKFVRPLVSILDPRFSVDVDATLADRRFLDVRRGHRIEVFTCNLKLRRSRRHAGRTPTDTGLSRVHVDRGKRLWRHCDLPEKEHRSRRAAPSARFTIAIGKTPYLLKAGSSCSRAKRCRLALEASEIEIVPPLVIAPDSTITLPIIGRTISAPFS